MVCLGFEPETAMISCLNEIFVAGPCAPNNMSMGHVSVPPHRHHNLRRMGGLELPRLRLLLRHLLAQNWSGRSLARSSRRKRARRRRDVGRAEAGHQLCVHLVGDGHSLDVLLPSQGGRVR